MLVVSLFLINGALVSSEVSYCCEKTNSGSWCINAPQDSCDDSFRSSPTSCESTSYCRTGTCIDSSEGTCMENTPEKVCQDDGGVWKEGDADEQPQCDLGCCLVGDQAAFVTQTRCKRLSSLYSLETNFNTGINSEIACIASANPRVKGACVFEKEFKTTCKFTSRTECQDLESSSSDSDVEFHEGRLCSDERLETNCGRTKDTTCVEGKDEVYFVDSCGNVANIYDSGKINDQTYWSEIVDKADSCGGDGSANDPSCGNCDYFSGSTCKASKRGEDRTPTHGENICRDLGCEYEGEDFAHGETWCADAKGVSSIQVATDSNGDFNIEDPRGEDLPGGRHSRLLCYNGEVSVEPCAEFRQEVCIESSIGDFSTAACRVNMWQDCVSQIEKKDCENTDRRDCQWTGSDEDVVGNDIKCSPKYSPGFDFWEANSDAESLCSLGTVTCIVEIKENIFGNDEKIVKGEECMDGSFKVKQSWIEKQNNLCVDLGDCGIKDNYLGYAGYHNESVTKVEDVDD